MRRGHALHSQRRGWFSIKKEGKGGLERKFQTKGHLEGELTRAKRSCQRPATIGVRKRIEIPWYELAETEHKKGVETVIKV